jgi:hypothetical protein
MSNYVNDEHRDIEEEKLLANPDLYICQCGCRLQFINFENGLDIYVENSWIITENAMVEYCWESFVSTNKYKIWQELKEYIVQKYNDNDLIHRGPFIHLYNYYVNNQDDPIPLNGKLYYENAF